MLCCMRPQCGRSCPIADVVNDNTMTIVAASAGAHFTTLCFRSRSMTFNTRGTTADMRPSDRAQPGHSCTCMPGFGLQGHLSSL